MDRREADGIDWRRDWAGLALAWLVLSAMFWPMWPLVPGFGLDPGWRLGLSWGMDMGLQFGPEVAFTYGPLGWLLQPMATSWTQIVVASVVHVAAVAGALAASFQLAQVRLALEPTRALLVAAVSIAIALVLAPSLQVAVIIGAVALLATRSSLAIVLLGVGLGVLGQTKLSDALLALGFAVLLTLGARGWRGLLVLIASTAAAWLIAWLAVGQALSNVPEWLTKAVDVGLSQTRVMAVEIPGFAWHYIGAIAIVTMLLLAAWRSASDLGRWAKVMLPLAVGWALWVTWKGAFGRHDHGHLTILVGMTAVLGVALILLGGRRGSLRLGIGAMLVALILYASTAGPFLRPLDRTDRLQSLGRSMRALSSEAYRTTELAKARAELTRRYSLTPELVAQLGDEPTMADQWDITAVWAAEEPVWRPVPVLQIFSAYSNSLDETTLDDLIAEPRQILRSVPYVAIDGRNPAWESPPYQALIYCSYEERVRTEKWQILDPSEADRCGAIEADPTGPIEADAGELIGVPRRDGEMTLVTIEPKHSLVDQVVALLHKPAEIRVEYGSRRWRYGALPRAERIMLNMPTRHPSFSMPLSPHAIISTDYPVTYTFEFQQVAAAPTRAPGAQADITDLVVRAAGENPRFPETPTFTNPGDVDVDPVADPCIRVTAAGADPRLSLSVPHGKALWVRTDPGGSSQVFLSTGEPFDQAQSMTLETSFEPFELQMPPRPGQPEPTLRLDPPIESTTEICLVPAT